jgi:autotransporter-associated beta strand protein
MKSRSNPFLLISAALAFTASAHAADLTWSAAIPGTWDTSNTNWSGSSWNNGTPDNAIFNNASGTVTLSEAITGGSLSFYNGGAPSGAHELLLTGSNLSVGSVLSWGGYYGPLGGGGVDSIGQAYDQRLRFDNMTLNVSGNATVRRGMLYFNAATVNVGGTINSADAWSVFRSDNSTVTATGGIDLSVIASQVELYGGTVTTPFIKVGNAAFAGTGGLTMGNGVTVVASQNNSDFIQVYNNGDTNSRAAATLSSGGMTLDTSSYAVTVATSLNGGGGLTKTGAGTLTLSQSNSYTGATNVSQGMLVVSAAAWSFGNVGGGGASAGAVTVGSGATLRADNSVANQLNGLTLNGGTVDAINSGGNGDWGNFYLTDNVTSSGTSSLNADIALRTTNVDFSVASGGTLNVSGVLHNGHAFGQNFGSPSTVSKSGSGTMVISGTSTYTGATTVSAGTLLVTGALSNSAVTVNGGAFGGTGTVGGGLTLNGGLFQVANLADALDVTGTVSLFTGFGIDDLAGIDWNSIADGTYTLINGTLGAGVFTALANNSLASAYDIDGLSGSRVAYFQEGSLQLVVIPEPRAALLGGLGMLCLLRRRR